MNIQKKKLSELNPAVYNPRKNLMPNDSEYQKIKKSIEEFGYIDPIIINNDGTIIGGHQRFKVLSELNYTEIMCVVVDLDKDHEKALNIALNKISGDWDIAKLKNLLEEIEDSGLDIALTGFEIDELSALIESGDFLNEYDGENDYTDKIEVPKYEPTKDKPTIDSLVDINKTNELISEIDKLDIDNDIKHFLRLAAYRFLVFSYEDIAEYYAHSEPNVQAIMERLALVIIDYDKAIENGFVELTSEIMEQLSADGG